METMIETSIEFPKGDILKGLSNQEFKAFINASRMLIKERSIHAIHEEKSYLKKDDIKVLIKFFISYNEESAVVQFETIKSSTSDIILKVARETFEGFIETILFRSYPQDWFRLYTNLGPTNSKTVSKKVSKESLPENSNAFHLLDDDASETESVDLGKTDVVEPKTVLVEPKTVVFEPKTVIVEPEETDVVETETVLTTVQNEETKPLLWGDYISSSEDEDDEDDEGFRPTTPIVIPIIHNESHIDKKISDADVSRNVETQSFERTEQLCN